jgi:hypothetical protein
MQILIISRCELIVLSGGRIDVFLTDGPINAYDVKVIKNVY